jgi:hypothetical protein
MRKLVPLLLLLGASLALEALAQNRVAARTWRMPVTGSTCTTLDAGFPGMPLDSASGWRVTGSAPGTDSRITAGSLDCCFKGVVNTTGASGASQTLRWRDCNSQLDFTPTTGVRDSSSLDFPSYVGTGAVMYLPNGVTLGLADAGTADAGVQLDVTLEMRAK